ncbi:ABC transporter permease [Nitrospina gracilis]|nr:ABC transporter permease subunit [Nitrospina gracilis]
MREIIAGKFLGCLCVVAVMLLLSSYSVIFILFMGSPEIGPILSGYLGILLMAACYISLGIFASSLTDNQIIAAVISFGFILFMWIIGWAAQSAGPELGELLNYISLVSHMESFLQGVIDSSDVAYYLSFIAFGLFLTYRVVESRRWS